MDFCHLLERNYDTLQNPGRCIREVGAYVASEDPSTHNGVVFLRSLTKVANLVVRSGNEGLDDRLEPLYRFSRRGHHLAAALVGGDHEKRDSHIYHFLITSGSFAQGLAINTQRAAWAQLGFDHYEDATTLAKGKKWWWDAANSAEHAADLAAGIGELGEEPIWLFYAGGYQELSAEFGFSAGEKKHGIYALAKAATTFHTLYDAVQDITLLMDAHKLRRRSEGRAKDLGEIDHRIVCLAHASDTAKLIFERTKEKLWFDSALAERSLAARVAEEAGMKKPAMHSYSLAAALAKEGRETFQDDKRARRTLGNRRINLGRKALALALILGEKRHAMFTAIDIANGGESLVKRGESWEGNSNYLQVMYEGNQQSATLGEELEEFRHATLAHEKTGEAAKELAKGFRKRDKKILWAKRAIAAYEACLRIIDADPSAARPNQKSRVERELRFARRIHRDQSGRD